MKLLCLDSNSILNRAFYGVKLLTAEDGTYTNAIYGFMNILHKLLSDVRPDAVACAFDLKAPTFRHKMYDGYKAQRKGMPEELAQQLPIIKELLQDLGYRIITLEGYEADDILGTLSARCEQQGHECFIATGDRDSLQLIGARTTVLLASSKMGRSETVVCDEAYFQEKYGTTPMHLVDIKALMGDSSDNIPGVAGIGEKTALKLIGQYGDIETIYADLEHIDATKSVKAKLEAGKESAFLSKTLATIDRSVPLDCTIEDFIPGQIREQEAFQLLSRLGMSSIIKRLGLSGEYLAPQEDVQQDRQFQPLQLCGMTTAQLLEQAGLQTPVSLCVRWNTQDEDQIDALAVAAGEKMVLCGGEDGPDIRQVTALLESPNPKLVFDCKRLYRWALSHGCKLNNLRDDVMLSEKSVTLQMTEAFEKCNKTVVGVQAVTKEAIKKYATCKIVESYGRLHKIDDIVEKPQREEDIYSLLAPLGRYIVTPDVFDVIEKTPEKRGNETYLTDSLQIMAKNGGIFVYEFEGERFDFGNKLGYIKGFTKYALSDPRFKDEYLKFLKEIVK